jgi:hypothetical protein
MPWPGKGCKDGAAIGGPSASIQLAVPLRWRSPAPV